VLAYVGLSQNLRDLNEVLYCDPKGTSAFLRILSTEGRGVRLCWAFSKPKGPKGSHGFYADLFYGRARCSPMLGAAISDRYKGLLFFVQNVKHLEKLLSKGFDFPRRRRTPL